MVIYRRRCPAVDVIAVVVVPWRQEPRREKEREKQAKKEGEEGEEKRGNAVSYMP